jgi:hypothetical protein
MRFEGRGELRASGKKGPIRSSHPHHDVEATNNWKRRPLKGVNVLGIRYCYPPVRVSGSDLCAVRIVGMNLPTRMRIVWRRGKAKFNRLLDGASPETPTAHGTTYSLPYEIVEIIIPSEKFGERERTRANPIGVVTGMDWGRSSSRRWDVFSFGSIGS